MKSKKAIIIAFLLIGLVQMGNAQKAVSQAAIKILQTPVRFKLSIIRIRMPC
jgi:hypothetical protein